MTKRRARGEGCIQRLADGKWRGYVTRDGARIYRRGKTKTEVANLLKEVLAQDELKRRRKIPRLTDFIREQLDGPLMNQLAHGTWHLYETFYRTKIAPQPLGEMLLTEIGQHDVQALIDHHRPIYSASTVRRIGSFLCMILERALEMGWIKKNPARKIKYPTIYETERSVLGVEDVVQFLQIFPNPRLRDMVTVALHTGLRRGELCGIRWIDVEVDQRILNVRVQIVRIDDGIEETRPKTRSSIRSIDLTDLALEAMLRQPRRSAYVFTTESGLPMRPDTLGRDFRLAVEKSPFRGLHLHDLRASFISLLLSLGTDVRTVQEMVGHTTADMTLRVYARSHRALKRQAADALQAATLTQK